jgi:hypothetical protein
MLVSHRQTILETLGRSPIHPFPARMAPGIALDALAESKKPLRVLDPMSGSGTALAVAQVNGHQAFGLDLDPLAVLLARVWTQPLDPQLLWDKTHEVLGRAKAAFSRCAVAHAYPQGSDEATRKFVRYWFDDYARRQLASLAGAIRRVRDEAVRDVLWCGFSRLIITKQAGASLAMDLSHSRPHKAFGRAPVKPFNRFVAAMDAVISNCPEHRSGFVWPKSTVQHGDARELPFHDRSIDLVVTSPPYLNAIDYMRCSKFSLIWMGYRVSQLREIRAGSVGSEVASDQAQADVSIAEIARDLRLRPQLSSRDYRLLTQYIFDMHRAVGEVARVLRDGARAVYVVGDSTVRGTYISNSLIVTTVAQSHGLSLTSRQSRILPANRRYLPPPKREAGAEKMDGRMRREVVLVLERPRVDRGANGVRRAT